MGAASLNIVIWPNSLLRSNWPQWKSKAQMDTIRLQASWHNASPPQLQSINFQVTVGVTLAPLSLLPLPRNEMSVSEPSWLPARCHKRVCDPFLPVGPHHVSSMSHSHSPCVVHHLGENYLPSFTGTILFHPYSPFQTDNTFQGPKKSPQRLRTQPACTRSFTNLV